MRSAPALLAISFGIAACATTPGAEQTDAQAERQRSSAVLFVERPASPIDGQPVTTHVGARFVQYAGLEAESLPDLLGMPHVPGAAIGCAERVEATVDAESGHSEARLIDVGAIDVRAGDRTVRLEPRRFPDLWNVVSGVIYANDSELPGDTWHFSVPGSAQDRIGATEVDARSPDDLSGVTVADQAFAAGATVALPHRAFGVRWTRGDHDDGVTVTFEPGGSSDRPTTIACTAHDDGSLDVDGTWADRIAELSTSGTVITVHRIRARAFSGAQVDSANVVFDVSMRGRGE